MLLILSLHPYGAAVNDNEILNDDIECYVKWLFWLFILFKFVLFFVCVTNSVHWL